MYLKNPSDLEKARISIDLLSELKFYVIEGLISEVIENTKNTDELSDIYNLYSRERFVLGDYKKALELLDKSIEFADKKDKEYLAMLYLNKSRNYLKIGDNKLAKEWLNKALIYDEKLREKNSMIVNEIEKY